MKKSAIAALGIGGITVVAAGWAMGSSSRAAEQARSGLGYRHTLLVQMRVSDLDRAVKFYHEVLDFDIRVRRDDLDWAEMTFGIPGVAVGLGAGGEVKGSGSISLNIGVKNVDAARKLLESRGVHFLGETKIVPEKVKLADFEDPDGNRIRLAESLLPQVDK
ncbi:MAG: VOC family protein [Phycisphaerae bacterium]|nr:VOC family protein [Phycisphaerae bacterium]